jgi:hypothetical protein
MEDHAYGKIKLKFTFSIVCYTHLSGKINSIKLKVWRITK